MVSTPPSLSLPPRCVIARHLGLRESSLKGPFVGGTGVDGCGRGRGRGVEEWAELGGGDSRWEAMVRGGGVKKRLCEEAEKRENQGGVKGILSHQGHSSHKVTPVPFLLHSFLIFLTTRHENSSGNDVKQKTVQSHKQTLEATNALCERSKQHNENKRESRIP